MCSTVKEVAKSCFGGLIVVLAAMGSAQAGGRAISCYEQAVIPAAYQVVQERVLVRAATTQIVEEPPLYSYQTRKVVIQPELISYRTVAPVYQTQARNVLLRPASVGWEYQVRKGRRILCKVKHPAVYQTVHERVLVKQGGRVAIRQPAIYGTVREKVLVRPGVRRKVQVPAVYKTISRRMKTRDAQVVWQPVSVRGSCRR